MIREFNAYQNILVIQPDIEASAWAIFADKTGRLLECGIAEPFAVVSGKQALADTQKKLQRIWEQRVGFSRNPELLVVETPRLQVSEHCSSKAFFSGVLTQMFGARKSYLPGPEVAPGNEISELDQYGELVLKAELFRCAPRYRAKIRRTVALGLWAYAKWEPEHAKKVIKKMEAAYV